MVVEASKDVLETIRSKHAVRKFKQEALPEDVINAILDAGRRSQSSKNTQPWTFVAIQDRETLKQLSECGNFAGHLAGAAFGIALVASPDFKAPEFDLGQSAAYMQLAAWGLGVGSCIASMWESDKAKAILGIPPEYHFDTAISFGWPAEDHVPAKMGGRKPLDEIVRKDRW
jgi:nitroreductase